MSAEEHPPRGFCGPKVVIAGAMKCATNYLARLLGMHEDSLQKSEHFEQHYFSFMTHGNLSGPSDSGSLENRRRYAAQLVNAVGSSFAIDKSPSYFTPYHPDLASRVRSLLPHAKVVVAVCDPTVRLWSHYHHEQRTTPKTAVTSYLEAHGMATFAAMVARFNATSSGSDSDAQRWAEREFLERGYYGVHMLDWQAAFGANVLLVNTDGLSSPGRVAKTVRGLLSFAGLSLLRYPWANLSAALPHAASVSADDGYAREAVPPVEAAALDALYAPHNALLRSLAGIDFSGAARQRQIGHSRRHI